MAKKYIFADSTYVLSNPPKGVTVLEFDTDTNTLGIYNNKKAAASIPVQPETEDNNTFEAPIIPSKLSELQNDVKFITIADVDGKYALKDDAQSFLSDISYNNEDKVLSFKFKLSDGTDSVQNISVKDLVDTYTAGDGITIENNTISFNGNIPDVSNFITISDVTTALSDYALKSQIPAIPQMPSVPTKLSELQNDTKFITKQEIPANDYTAYQVFATDTEIPADSESKDLGGYVYKAIPANMTENVIIRSSSVKDKCDVIIDWGDNTTTSAMEMQTVSQNVEEKDYEYKATHVYQSAGKYIVKIYGKNYYGVAHKEENLMCRVFDADLPIAPNFQNFNYFCGYANKLLNICIPQYVPYLTVRNWTACFKSCVNLRQATGFKRLTPYLIGCGNIFQGCENLVHTDFRLPILGTISMAFRDCKSLADNIQDLEPIANFAKGQTQNIGFIFNNCSSLQGTITPSKWFEDKDVTWRGTRRAFTGCNNITNFDSIPTFYDKNLADKGDAKSDQLWNN